MRRTTVAGVVTAVLVGVVIAVWLVLSGPSTDPSASSHTHKPISTPKAWFVKNLGPYAVRGVVNDGTDVWAIADSALLDLDGAALSPLGPVHHFRNINHVVVCHGQVLVTYDDGKLAEFQDGGGAVTRKLTYGHPIYDEQLTGTMACGGSSLFVAMPLEARVLRFALPSLRLIATIRGAARLITGLAYTHGTLYVEDASQSAVITVKDNVAYRWKMTAPEPDEIVGLRDPAAILTHQHSICIGYVASGHHQEVGLNWSTQAPVRALAIAQHHGVILDTAGWLYRFNTTMGSEDAAPLHLSFGEYATSLALTAADQAVLAIPSANRLVSVAPTAWKPLHSSTEPAADCLDPSE